MLRFGAKLRERERAFALVENVEFFNSHGYIEFGVAATVNGAKGARTHDFTDLVTVVN